MMERVPRAGNNWFDVQDLGDGVWGIAEWGHAEEVVSFLLVGDEDALLIDTGLGFFSIAEAAGSVTSMPVTVLNTHSHFDHIGENAGFEQLYLPDHPLNRERAVNGLSADFLAPLATSELFWGKIPDGIPTPYVIQPFPQAAFFQDGAKFDCSPFQLESLHTPGHSGDHMSFFDRERGFLFAGDNLYDGPVYVRDLTQYRRSIARLAALPGIKRIFPSHNGFEFDIAKLHQLNTILASLTITELTETIGIDGPFRLESAPYDA